MRGVGWENVSHGRCRLHPAYVLLLDLIRKYRNNCQDQLGIMFGIDQAAGCRLLIVDGKETQPGAAISGTRVGGGGVEGAGCGTRRP